MGKKYLFPFEKEKSNIPWREIFVSLACAYAVILILCVAIVKASREQNTLVQNTFYKASPDLIVVPTGDYGRIPKAIEFAKKFNLSNIFITGVYKKNSVDMILPESNFDEIDPNLMDIDYWARNTIENAISTLKYISTKNEIKNILVVSSDYHLLRLKMIFDNLIDEDSKKESSFKIYYYGVENSYTRFDHIIKLHKEAIKYVRGWMIMKLWTPEVQANE